MQIIDAANLDYRTLNEALRGAETDYTIEGCCGQRFIAAGMSDKALDHKEVQETADRVSAQFKQLITAVIGAI